MNGRPKNKELAERPVRRTGRFFVGLTPASAHCKINMKIIAFILCPRKARQFSNAANAEPSS